MANNAYMGGQLVGGDQLIAHGGFVPSDDEDYFEEHLDLPAGGGISARGRRAVSAGRRRKKERPPWDNSAGQPIKLRQPTSLFTAELQMQLEDARARNVAGLASRPASAGPWVGPAPGGEGGFVPPKTKPPVSQQVMAIEEALEKTVDAAIELAVEAKVADGGTAAALAGPGNEKVVEAINELQEEQGFAPPAAVSAVQGWKLADMLRSVDLGGTVAKALTTQLRRKVERSGRAWDASMELSFAAQLSAGGGQEIVQGLLRDVPLHSVLAAPIATGLSDLQDEPPAEQLGAAAELPDYVAGALVGGSGEAQAQARKAPKLSTRFVDEALANAAPPQVRVSFKVVHQEGRAVELAAARYRASLCAAWGLTDKEVTFPKVVDVFEDTSLPLDTRRALWGGPDAPDSIMVATYQLAVIAPAPTVERVSQLLEGAGFETWAKWLRQERPVVKFGLTLDAPQCPSIAEYERDYAPAVKDMLLQEIRGTLPPRERKALEEVTADDVRFTLRAGSVEVDAEVSVPNAQVATSVSNAAAAVLSDPERSEGVFGLPMTEVRSAPEVEANPPPAPGDAKFTTPLGVPEVEKQVEAPALSLGALPDLLAGLDGLVGPMPAAVCKAEAKAKQAAAVALASPRNKGGGAGDGASAEQVSKLETAAAGALLAAMTEEHTARPDAVVPWDTGNYGVHTTSAVEFWFVANPTGQEAVQARGGADKEWPVEERLREDPERWKYHRMPKGIAEFKAAREKVAAELLELGGAPITDEEFYGGRLYTGPLFEKYNAVLRGLPNRVPFFVTKYMQLCQGNRYEATLHAINRAIVKLGKIVKAEKLYRGISGMRLPESFFQPDEHGFGTMGGVEFGFMSATSDRKVSIHYAKDRSPSLVYEIDQGMLDRGADLSWFSQYPHEAETCFPPCTGLELQRKPDGQPAKRTEGKVVIVQLRAQPPTPDDSRPPPAPPASVEFKGHQGATLEEAWRKWDKAEAEAKEKEEARSGVKGGAWLKAIQAPELKRLEDEKRKAAEEAARKLAEKRLREATEKREQDEETLTAALKQAEVAKVDPKVIHLGKQRLALLINEREGAARQLEEARKSKDIDGLDRAIKQAASCRVAAELVEAATAEHKELIGARQAAAAQLQAATAGRDEAALEAALEAGTKARVDMALIGPGKTALSALKAEREQAERALKEACRGRDAEVLKKALATAEDRKVEEKVLAAARVEARDLIAEIEQAAAALLRALMNEEPTATLLDMIKATPAAAAIAPDATRCVPLHRAVLNNAAVEVFLALLSLYPEGAKAGDSVGSLPLHFALDRGRAGPAAIEVVQPLLAANPEAAKAIVPCFGRLPLHDAVRNNAAVEVVRALLAAYPEGTEIKDREGKTPLDWAKERGHTQIVQLLEPAPAPAPAPVPART